MTIKKDITILKNYAEHKSLGKLRLVLNTLKRAGADVRKLSGKELFIDASSFKNSKGGIKGVHKLVQNTMRFLGGHSVAFVLNKETFSNPKNVETILNSWKAQKTRIFNEDVEGETEIIVVVPEGAVDGEIIATATAITETEAEKVSDGIKEELDKELGADDVDFTDLDDVDLDEDEEE